MLKSVKIPSFSGKPEEYQIWLLKMTAFCGILKCAEYMKTTKHPDLPEYEEEGKETNDDGTVRPDTQKEKDARAGNLMAMLQLTVAFNSEWLMGKIFASRNDKWPSGRAYVVMKSLADKFAPTDNLSRVELRVQLNKLTLKEGEDPANLFESISTIKNRFDENNQNIDTVDLVAAAISAAPSSYHSVLTNLQVTQATALTLEDVAKTMQAHCRLQQNATNNGPSEKEIQMQNIDTQHTPGNKGGGRGYQGRGYNGGRNRGRGFGRGRGQGGKNGGRGRWNNRPKGPCYTCGGAHIARDCWEHPDNANRRPPGWTSKLGGRPQHDQEHTAANLSMNTWTEFSMMSQSGLHHANILKDPNVFIMDSASSYHLTNNTLAMRELHNADENDWAKCTNGTLTKPEKLGTLSVIACDNMGNEKSAMNISTMFYSSKSPFNVISSTKLEKEGWTTVHGDSTKTAMLGPDKQTKLIFDIVVLTKYGLVKAIRLKRMEALSTGHIQAATQPISTHEHYESPSIARAHE